MVYHQTDNKSLPQPEFIDVYIQTNEQMEVRFGPLFTMQTFHILEYSTRVK